jgi:hypothetical protein
VASAEQGSDLACDVTIAFTRDDVEFDAIEIGNGLEYELGIDA